MLFDWHGELAELVYSGNTQLHGFNDPPLPVSVQGATSYWRCMAAMQRVSLSSRLHWPCCLHFSLVRSHVERDKEVRPWGRLWDNISLIWFAASNSQFDTDAHSIQHCKLCKSNGVRKKNEATLRDESAVIWIFSVEAWRWRRFWWLCAAWHNQQDI